MRASRAHLADPAYLIDSRRKRAGHRSGFSLIDVLVSLSVVFVLMGLVLPSYSRVREHANRVVCRSNMRQIGLGIALYAQENRDKIPSTKFVLNTTMSTPEETLVLRLAQNETPSARRWDGLGILFDNQILPVFKLFYCPSYFGNHQFDDYVTKYETTPLRVWGNYQYRGLGPNGESRLSFIEPNRSSLVTDGMRTRGDFSHSDGCNVLRADLSMFWYTDRGMALAESLPEDAKAGPNAKVVIESAWYKLDQASGLP